MANGAVPSDAGSRSAYTRSVSPGGRRRRVLVDAMRPDDLLGRGHAAGGVPRPASRSRGVSTDAAELTAADGEDSAAAADLFFLGRERHRLVGLLLRDVGQLARRGIERELVAVLRIGDRLRTLDNMEAEIEGVAAKDVAHVVAADDNELQPGFLRHALQSGRAHLTRRADGEAVAGDDERLAAVHPLAEVRHQIAEGACLPSLVQCLQALGDTVGRWRDLIGVDRIELLRPGSSDPRKSAPDPG